MRALLAAVLLAACVPIKAQERAELDEVRGEVDLLARALEAYPSESDFVKIRSALYSISGEAARPYFETRDKALHSAYETLAAVDYTRASNLPALCNPAERRAALLRRDDGLLAGSDGRLTPWFAAVLGIERVGESSDQATVTAAASVADRARALARVRELSASLEEDHGDAESRGQALCERAALFESLAVSTTGTVPVDAASSLDRSAATAASAPIEASWVPPATGRCAAFCDGPPRSYSGGAGGSSG